MAGGKSSNREKVKEIVAGIEDGIKELFQSEQYADYLRTLSRFHNYSYRNTILIHMQRPDATLVAGYNKWKNQFKRHVKKGEKGITILAPTPFKKKIEQKKIDPDTHAPVRDADGNIVMEEKTVEIPMFRPVKVFDVKQTEGEPLHHLASDLTGDVQHYEAFLEALRRVSPVPIEFRPIQGSEEGYFSLTNQYIAIKEGLSEAMTINVCIHEIAHATLHNRNLDEVAAAAGKPGAELPKSKSEETMEVEAESVSYAVCQYYGIETSTRSMGYIASWSSGKELPELKASLETISSTANFLITNIDRHFAEICRERGIMLEQEEPDVPTAEEPEGRAPEAEGEYVLTMEKNPQPVGDIDRHLIRARKVSDQTLNPEQVLFIGNASVCSDLLGLLQRGEISPDDFFHVSAAVVSRYTTQDGADMDAFVGKDDKVYMGRRDHYDNRGHYINNDKSLLHVSDNDKMFSFLSGTGYTETQSEMLEEGYFTQEDYAEYADLQVDVLAQFRETEPLMFADEPFCFISLDASEVKQEIIPSPEVPEHQEALYMVDNVAYLHFQTCDAGYDYTLYDINTLREIDGGQTAVLSVAKAPPLTLREAAAMAIRDCMDLEGKTIVEVPLNMVEMLEGLREAGMRDMQEVINRINSLQNSEAGTIDGSDTKLDEYPMPDPAFSSDELERDYGYTGGDMLPASKEQAARLLEQDFTVYAIVDGGSAEMVFDGDELDEYPHDRVFAITKEEWETSQDFKQAVASRMERQGDREQAFLNHNGDCFAIYQLRRDESTRDLRYESLENIHKAGLSPLKSNYELAYTGSLPAGQDTSILEELWARFNTDHPADYMRPSVSPSDIIALKQDGVVSCHYVDLLAFTAMPNFFQAENYLKTAEMSTEDDFNMIDGIINNGPKEPTADELEARAMAGERISITDFAKAIQRENEAKRKSVVAQLRGRTNQDRKKTAKSKNHEKER